MDKAETCENCGRDLAFLEICEYCGHNNHKLRLSGWAIKKINREIEAERAKNNET